MIKTPYELIDGLTGALVCRYRALAVACRDAATKNKAIGDNRYYVKKPNGAKLYVRGE